jgi:hypothetical protein
MDTLAFMLGWASRWISALRARFHRRGELLLELIVLRHQLLVLQRTGTRRPCLRPSERLFWVFLSRSWANWQRSLIIVEPATVLRWRRRGLRAIWASGSRGHWRGGRPRISSAVRALIVRMSRENFLWGAPRIHGELLKLGFDVSQATVSRYMPWRSYPPRLRWRTFLRNQALGLGTIDFRNTASRISDQLLNLVRGWFERVARRSTKLRDGISGGLLESSWTSHLLWPSGTSNRTDQRAIHGVYTPVDLRDTTKRGDHSTTAGRRLSPYHSRASPRLKLPAPAQSARSRSCRAYAIAPRWPSGRSADSHAKREDNLTTIRC